MTIRRWLPASLLLLLVAGCSAPADDAGDATPSETGEAVAADVLVVGHRGAGDVAPENTVPSFEVAAEAGVDFIEVDVQLSADGVPFLFHDSTPERTTDVADVFPDRVDDPITSFTWDELQQLDAGSWFREDYAGTPIATLDDAATAVEPTAGVDIELKSPQNSPGVAQVVADALQTGPWPALVEADLVVVSSFDVDALREFHEILPDVPVMPIIDEIPDAAWVADVADMADSVAANYQNLTDETFALADDAGLAVWAWTVDDAGSMRALIDLGVAALVTDVPGLGVETVANPGG